MSTHWKKSLSKHKKEVGRLNLEEMNLDNDVLHRLTKNNYGEMTRQIVMPNSYKQQALKLAHAMLPAGHRGVQVTLARCQKFSQWISMKRDVENYYILQSMSGM